MNIISALLLLVQVPNYADLPLTPDKVVVAACAQSDFRLQAKLNDYSGWVRKLTVDKGGKLQDREATIYIAEAEVGLKPYLEALRVIPKTGGLVEDCWHAEDDGTRVIQDIAGTRFGNSHGYVQNSDGSWSKRP
jgi:hypothetical protein